LIVKDSFLRKYVIWQGINVKLSDDGTSMLEHVANICHIKRYCCDIYGFIVICAVVYLTYINFCCGFLSFLFIILTCTVC